MTTAIYDNDDDGVVIQRIRNNKAIGVGKKPQKKSKGPPTARRLHTDVAVEALEGKRGWQTIYSSGHG